ncbi:hypothetical protein [Actinoallomurus sp. CA-142502]|uniref:hypothetical protein n=1 Tax=Actinoallomurus sp. CA-142502 TaxID=3239885 RepID=UPI003D94019D
MSPRTSPPQAEGDPLTRSIRSFEAARAALGMPGVSWAADLTRLDALVRRYPMQARSILCQIETSPYEADGAC